MPAARRVLPARREAAGDRLSVKCTVTEIFYHHLVSGEEDEVRLVPEHQRRTGAEISRGRKNVITALSRSNLFL